MGVINYVLIVLKAVPQEETHTCYYNFGQNPIGDECIGPMENLP